MWSLYLFVVCCCCFLFLISNRVDVCVVSLFVCGFVVVVVCF